MKIAIIIASLVLSFTFSAQADNSPGNIMDELDPFAFNIEALLKSTDQTYEKITGQSTFLRSFNLESLGCAQTECEVYAQVVKSEQKLFLYIHGQMVATWPVSTGIPGRETPLLNSHPDGRIYNAYTSTKFPGGDYDGLGNMPFAVFIQDGFAIHGTSESNWPKLGSKASHGCIRIHPDNAKYFNGLVRTYGVENVWISVQN